MMPKPIVLDVPPPGAGVMTLTCAVPATDTSAAAMMAVSCEALPNAVVRELPFQSTVELLVNPLPLTTSVRGPVPAVAEAGASPLTTGAGLFTANVIAVEAPLGVATVIDTLPAVAMSAASIAAVICVALTNVVVRAAPFQRTVAPLTKFVPLTVSVNAGPPAVAVVGDNDDTLGAGALLIVNVIVADVPLVPLTLT